MFSHKTIKTIITITALCLVSLAGAEEKETSQIEPKLVYEKRFDFEIEQGKIGEDGSLFPTIFVTKDNRVLFLDKNGNVHKTLSFTWSNYIAKISDNGKNVVIMTPFNKEKNEFNVKIYDTSGKIMVQKRMFFTTGAPVDIFLTKGAKDVIIFFAGGDLVEPCGIGFYDGKLNLRRLYTKNDFKRPLIPGSYWRNPGFNGAWLNKNDEYLIGIGSDVESFGVYVFKVADGRLKFCSYFDTLSIARAMISNNGKILVLLAYEPWQQVYFDKKGKNIRSYVLCYHNEKNENRITTLSRNSKYTQLNNVPIIFSPGDKYFTIAYEDSVFLFETEVLTYSKYSIFGVQQSQVLGIYDDSKIVIKGMDNLIVITDVRKKLEIKQQCENPILDACLYNNRITVLTTRGIFIFVKEDR